MFEFLKNAAKNGAEGGRASLQSILYMLQYPQFFWYPALYITSVIIVFFFWLGTFFGMLVTKGHSDIILFLLSLLTIPYFAFVFFNGLSACATTYYALGLFNNEPITIIQSYGMAVKKTGSLLL